MKLYVNALCPFVHRVRVGLHLRGIEPQFTFEEVDLQQPSPAELCEINPTGSVPTLALSPGLGFHESLLILEFFDTLPGAGPRLYGEGPLAVAQTKILWDAVNQKVLSHLQAILYSRANAVQLRKAVSDLPSAFEWLSQNLIEKNTKFFGGTTLNAVDVALAPFVVRYLALREISKDIPMPRSSTPAATYFENLRQHPAVSPQTPSTSQLATVFEKYFHPDPELALIHKASRIPVEKVFERCAQLNAKASSLSAKNIRFKASDSQSPWKVGQSDKGPQLEAHFEMPSYVEMLQALNALTILQESADHHTSFTLDGHHNLEIVLCTHEPVWGVSEKDFAFALNLTEKLLRI
jgi:glutathione S-transferase/pterin-4a-carbinolamine dehydratase